MGAWIVLLVAAIVMLWRRVSSLAGRIEMLESQLQKSSDALEPLERRVQQLEYTRYREQIRRFL